jgi:DNA replication and repair protein RecF
MGLARLNIHAVRNLSRVDLPGLQGTNVFYGDNGGGKTSVLESVFLLGMARSFRSAQIKTVIQHDVPACTVFGDWWVGKTRTAVGVTRERDGQTLIKLDGSVVKAVSELAELMPLQVINAQSFSLLMGGPADRRQYLDWGVFHVEHLYKDQWQRYQRCIKQRNSLLRRGKMSADQLATWTRELAAAGELVNDQRKAYFDELLPVFGDLIARLSPDLAGVELRYRRGWDRESSLLDSLQASERSDREQGFTHVGPQRADVRVLFEGHGAGDTLSRGQQKLVVCALKLAQGQLLGRRRQRACVYLVDDLPSELDGNHCGLVAEVLNELNAQVFISCVEHKEITRVWPTAGLQDMAMFHVEHGSVTRTEQ